MVERRSGLNSRGKGKRGEREVSTLIAAWWSPVEPEAKFASTPGSGGWGNAKLRGDFKVSSDLTTTAKRFPFTVEVKREQNWSEAELNKGKRSPVWGWWRQCIGASREERRVPMLWFRKNRRPWFVLLPDPDYVEYQDLNLIGVPTYDQWIPEELYGDVSGVHPAMYEAKTILAENPFRFAIPL